METKKRIILADDHQVFLDGMLLAFENHPEYEIIATFKNGDQLVRGVRKHKPDVVLTDISMPVLNGIDAIEQTKKEFPDMLCIVLTNFDSDHLILNSLEAGAFSYVNKIMDKEVIFKAIASSLDGVPHYCDSTSQRMLRLISESKFEPGMKRTEMFNTNEKKIIALFCKDKLVKEIADELCLALRTVERYKSNIMEKMGVKTASGIVMYAIRNKLVIPDDSDI
jgi:DNA-binding NarL/FixJ family response regulator